MMTIREPNDIDQALDGQASDWVIQLATGAATQADLRALERWRAQSPRHDEAFAQACRFWQALGRPLEIAVQSAGPQHAGSRLRASRHLGRRALIGGALAASAAMIGAAMVRPPLHLWPSVTELAADYRTGIGEQRRIDLADSASIEMNTRTSLNVHGIADHNIELVSGEAVVSAGPRPLTVFAAGGSASGSNVAFTLRHDGPSVRVTSLGGLVRVQQGSLTADLQARQQLTYDATGIGPTSAADLQVAAGWREGFLVFDDERLSHVVEEINRYRPGRIVVMNAALGDRRVTARFRLARLEAVLTQFQEAFGAKVTTLAGGFVLLS